MEQKKVMSREEARTWRKDVGKSGREVVFTNGCFDIIHMGHVKLLQQAKEEGDYLIVGLNSDDSVRKLKGEGRPVMGEDERAEVLAGLKCVDCVVIFKEDDPLEIIKCLEPDVLVKGGDWAPENIIGAKEVNIRGGRVRTIQVLPGRSTTDIIEYAGGSERNVEG